MLASENLGDNTARRRLSRIWDLLFGTWFLPGDRLVAELGLVNRDYPLNFTSQIKTPLIRDIDQTPLPVGSCLELMLNQLLGLRVCWIGWNDYRPVSLAAQHPGKVQRDVLKNILKTHCETWFGNEHGLSEQMSVAEYRAQVPVQDYEQLRPYTNLMALLEELRIWKLRIPLRVTFRHASAARSVTDSLWVEAVDSEGTVGFGESCPRSYVTGEDVDSCHRFFAKHRDELLREVSSLEDLRRWEATHQTEIDQAPAAWCALELALLDLLARRANSSLEELLGLPELVETFHYTAVLGDQSESAFGQQVKQYRRVGFEHFKVKLSGTGSRDTAKLALLNSEGVSAQHIRVDANNLWHMAADATSYLSPLAESFFAIEEPLSSGDYQGMSQLAASLGKMIILDESFQRAEQFSQIETNLERWLVNLRVSKMGGLLRSVEVARLAQEKNVGLIIGAQVGETSLLTRVALTVAQSARPALRGQEGAFGTRLLEADVVDPPLVFGERGRLSTIDNPSARSPPDIIRPTSFLEEF